VEAVNAMVRGPGGACVAGTIKTLEAEVHGSGDFEARGVQAQSLRAVLSGPGNMTLSGRTGALNAEVTGSGDLDAEHLEVGRAMTRSTGPGNIELQRVTESLNADLHGSGGLSASVEGKSVALTMGGPGDVTLHGKTDNLTAQLSGSGSLDGRDLHAGQASVVVRGPGNAQVNVRGKLETKGRQTSSSQSRLVTVDRSGVHDAQAN